VLGFYEGFSCGELSERYEIPEPAVKARLHRCRRRIREVLERRIATRPWAEEKSCSL